MIHVSNEACDTGGERYTPLAGSQGNLRDFMEIIALPPRFNVYSALITLSSRDDSGQ